MHVAHVAIVGAGLGGLAAAIRLSVRGVRVTVFEQGPRVGGKLNQWAADGWTFDTGPSLLTMPAVLHEIFADAGATLADALTLDPVDPICHYQFADGSVLDVTTDAARMAANIAAIAPNDVAAFFRFLAYAGDLYSVAAEPFLRHPMRRETLQREGWALLRSGPRARAAVRLASPATVHRAVSHYFRDPRLRQVFDRYATYNGSSPFRAPAVFCLIPFIEFSTGAWHPRGGMYRIAEALRDLAAACGATIHLNTPVSEIIVHDGRARGIQLASGDSIDADAVVANVDVLTTYERLLEPTATVRATRRTLRQLEPSYSGFVLLLGTRRTYPELPHHTVLFSADYRAEFSDIGAARVPPSDPTIYVCRATATDPSVAPVGCDNLFIMVNVPYLDERTDWDAMSGPYRDHILETLRRRGLDINESTIAVEETWTPDRLRRAYGAQRGAIYGFASNTMRASFLRPPNRSAAIAGLYFAGGSTHPGGGIPLALLSGRIAADLVCEDDAMEVA